MAKLTRTGNKLFKDFMGEFNDMYLSIEFLKKHKDKAVQEKSKHN